MSLSARSAAGRLGDAVDAVFDGVGRTVERRPFICGLASFAVLTAAFTALLLMPPRGSLAMYLAAAGMVSVSIWGTYCAILEVVEDLTGDWRYNYTAAALVVGAGLVAAVGGSVETVLTDTFAADVWFALVLAFASLLLYIVAVGLLLLTKDAYRRLSAAIGSGEADA